MSDTPDITRLEMDALWDDFHAAVNMTSAELSAWLATRAAGERSEPLSEELSPETGERVVAILQKRRTDLTAEDVETMYEVIDLVQREHPGGADPRAGEDDWRRALLSVGHDPLKPS